VDTSDLTKLRWATAAYQRQLPEVLSVSTEAAAKAMKESLQASFKKATVQSKPNTIATILNKNLRPEFWGGYGFQYLASRGIINTKPLVETGTLAQAVEDTSVTISRAMDATYAVVYMALPMAGDDCHFSRQRRDNQDFVYAWAHETGAGPSSKMYKFGVMAWGNEWEIPKRPWIEAGSREGLAKAKAIMARGAAQAQANFEASVASIGGRGFNGMSLDFDLGISFWDLVSLVIPPSSAYAVIGALDDYSHMMTGAFEFGSLRPWITRYVAGGMGMTRNVYKRKFRRALYS
jgi:hypothetical protein